MPRTAFRILTLAALLLPPAFPLDAQEKKEPFMRPAAKLELMMREVVSYPTSPVIDTDGTISVIPGETLVVRFDEKDGKLINPRLETVPDRHEGCVILECSHKDGHLLLRVRNPYKKFLHYKCATIEKVPGEPKIEPRNNLAVYPELVRFETYNGREIILFFRDFALHDTFALPKEAGKEGAAPAPAPASAVKP